ncbi:MAG: hypothetical protein JSU63_20325, partial [Phycisphaerales bacterium]
MSDPDTVESTERVAPETKCNVTSWERDCVIEELLASANVPIGTTRATRVVFEYGFEFVRDCDGGWALVQRTDPDTPCGPRRLARETGLRPVAIWTTNHANHIASFVLPPGFDLDEMEQQPVCISQILGSDGPNFILARNFMYFIRSLAYRIRKIAVLYAWHARRATREDDYPNRVGDLILSVEDVACEIDAFFGFTIRLIDALKRPVWERFAGTDKIPDTWNKLIEELPGYGGVRDEVSRTVEPAGTISDKLRKYRNFVEHYEPIAGRHPCLEVLHFPRTGTAVSLALPDDPEKRGRG